MKKTLLIFILLFIFGQFIGISQNAVINGKISPEINTEYIFIRQNAKVLICTDCEEFSADLNDNLEFEFQNLKPGHFEIWIEPRSKYNYDITSGYVNPNDTINLKIPVSFSCKYDQSINNKTCPICHKQNRVIPIVYGLVISKGIGRKYKIGGCITSECKPNWYCKRDKIDF